MKKENKSLIIERNKSENYLEKLLELILQKKNYIQDKINDIFKIISQISNLDFFHFVYYKYSGDLINLGDYWEVLTESSKKCIRKIYHLLNEISENY